MTYHNINLLLYFCEHRLVGNDNMFKYMMCRVVDRCLGSNQIYLRKSTCRGVRMGRVLDVYDTYPGINTAQPGQCTC